MARRHANALPTKAAQIRMALGHHGRNFAARSAHTLDPMRHHGRSLATRSARTLEAITIPPIILLTSDVSRLHQRVSRSPVARCHVNALPTKAANIRMAPRYHGRNLATRSAHTLQAIISHDTARHPAHQRHAAFTPACFALPSGTAPRKRTSHQGRAIAHGTAT